MDFKHRYTYNTPGHFLVEDEHGKFYIERDIPGYGMVRFDIAWNYQPTSGETRFITRSKREELEAELQANMPSLYNQVYGNGEPEPKQDEVGRNDMKALIEAMTKQNQELIQSVQKNPYEDAIVDAIVSKGKQISTESLLEEVKGNIDDFIKSEYGSLPSRIEVVTSKTRKVVEGIFHNKFEQILKFVERDIPAMLVGPAGSGKNHTLEQVAESLDLEFYFSNAITQEYKLTGFVDANGHFHETQFYKAFKNGGLFFLDEMDASIPEVLIILNAAIANKYFDFPSGKVQAHEDFRVVAASNTVGSGADSMYVGRNQLDAATLDRFAIIRFDYDYDVERQLAASDDLFEFIQELRKVIKRYDIRYVVSMRATISASKLDDIMDKKTIIDTVILKGMADDERGMVREHLGITNEYTRAI